MRVRSGHKQPGCGLCMHRPDCLPRDDPQQLTGHAWRPLPTCPAEFVAMLRGTGPELRRAAMLTCKQIFVSVGERR